MKQESTDEGLSLYQTKLENLKKFCQSRLDLVANRHIVELLDEIESRKNKGSIDELVSVIEDTQRFLEGSLTFEKYIQKAEIMRDKQSLGTRILGGCMLAVACAAVVALVITLGMVGAIVMGYLDFTLLVPAIGIASGCLAVADLAICVGALDMVGIFASKKTGLCGSMHNLAEANEATIPGAAQ